MHNQNKNYSVKAANATTKKTVSNIESQTEI